MRISIVVILLVLVCRFLERSGRAREIFTRCFSYFNNVNNYPLLLILTRQTDRIVLLDFVNGNCDFHQTRACLERTLNPNLEQSIISINEVDRCLPRKIFIRSFDFRPHHFHQVGSVVVQLEISLDVLHLSHVIIFTRLFQ